MTDSFGQGSLDRAMGVASALRGKTEYHVRFEVRSYDLTTIRTDLDHCTESGRGLIVWASIMIGVGATLLVSFIVALNTSPYPRLALRETLGWGALVFIVLGLAFVWMDRLFAKRAKVDLSYIKEKVDNLISMFEQENPTG